MNAYPSFPGRRALLLALPLLMLLGAPARAAQTWKLVWNDEFDGPSIDQSKWSFEINGTGGGNNELQYYTDRSDNARIENGKLIIEARKETFTGTDGTRNYTSARMRTLNKGDWKYGRIEARIKLPIGRGMWPAFWMLPTDQVYGGWPHSGEIDIMELIGQDPITVYGTLHYANSVGQHAQSNGAGYILTNGQTFNDDFHIFAVEWESNQIRWYVDNTLYETQTYWSTDKAAYPAPFDQKFHVLLNVAVGGSWPGAPDSSTVFPQQMVVDYVRVYQAVTVSQDPPSITLQPTSVSVAQNSNVTLSVIAAGGPTMTYQWYKAGAAISGATKSSLSLTNVSSADAANYTVTVTNPYGNITSNAATVAVTSDTFTPPTAPLTNISTRAAVGTGADVLIVGFVVGGTGAKKVLIRGIGPTLAQFSVPGTLADPILTLTKVTGEPVASNDDWYTADNAAEVDTTIRGLTFPYPAQSTDSALLLALPPGSYTAKLSGANNTTGVGMIEVYDLETNSTARLLNISSRARVGTDASVLITGFIIGGSANKRVLIRGIGATLSAFGVPGSLADPVLKLTTQGGTVLATNDNWGDEDSATIGTEGDRVGAFGLVAGSKDSALITTKSSGSYTAIVSGAGNTTGVGMVEMYDLE
jgi:beta-glucanase (GH16 family)